MPLVAGTRLGPYQIVAPLGAGGMGEVYRARDTRLGRDVAVKVLPDHLRADPEMHDRFKREAAVVASLSHPNVLALHDVGAEGGTAYAVMELVEGLTLRQCLADGPLPWARAMPLAIQLAQGLAAAHDRGIVHRDLKPENIIITPDGRAKILDFGLAKIAPPGTGSASLAPTLARGTEPGVVLGTYGYMSPEQVRGESADERSDVFALGAVIYEMVSRHRAFSAASPAEAMSAVLREDPPELASLVPDVSPGLERIVRRCLEKPPALRFRSAADLAYALEAVAAAGTSRSHSKPARTDSPSVSFRRLTFRNGYVAIARFTPDGAGVVYGAAWDGQPHEIFSSRTGSPESRSLGLPAGSLLSMSADGEMAVSLGYHNSSWWQVSGTLARVALAGGGVRPIQKDVGHADWAPDGRSLAFVRYKGGRCLLEYPAGRVLHETTEWMSHCRVSPDGRRVAFGRHHRSSEGEGDLCVVDGDGTLRTLVADLTNLNGIAWSPSGTEVWFSGINDRQRHGIWGATVDGGVREVYVSPTRVTLHDVRRDRGALVSMDEQRSGLHAGTTSDAREIDVSWFDGSVAKHLSADGSRILSMEAFEAENPHYGCYLRSFDGSPAVRLGDGIGTHLSADGEWVLAVLHHPRHALVMYPTGFGEAREVAVEGIERVLWAGFHPDGQHAFVVGATSERSRALYRVPLAGGPVERLWDEELEFDRLVGLPIAPDGERLVLKRVSGEHLLYSWRARAAEAVSGLTPNDVVLSFDDSGGALYVAGVSAHDRSIQRLDLSTGTRTAWRKPTPLDPRGIIFVAPPVVAADGTRYAYSYMRRTSNLYLVEGLGA